MPISLMPKFFDKVTLKPARIHEVEGMGAVSFASSLSSYLQKPVCWVSDERFTLNPFRMAEFVDTQQFYQMQCYRHEDRLWVAEEALRASSFGLVVCDIQKPIGLTQGRRLQLAAESGHTPGLCLIKLGHGANTAETRWQCEPAYCAQTINQDTDSTLWRWHLKKNKTGTTGAWEVKWDAKTRTVRMVSHLGNQSFDAQRVG